MSRCKTEALSDLDRLIDFVPGPQWTHQDWEKHARTACDQEPTKEEIEREYSIVYNCYLAILESLQDHIFYRYELEGQGLSRSDNFREKNEAEHDARQALTLLFGDRQLVAAALAHFATDQ